MFGHQRERTSATKVGISSSICTSSSSRQMKAFVYISFFFLCSSRSTSASDQRQVWGPALVRWSGLGARWNTGKAGGINHGFMSIQKSFVGSFSRIKIRTSAYNIRATLLLLRLLSSRANRDAWMLSLVTIVLLYLTFGGSLMGLLLRFCVYQSLKYRNI